MGLRVLVTRPQPGAARTAQRLQAAGFEPVVLPLSEIVAVAPALPDPLPGAVAVSSANAVRHAPATLLSLLADRPVFAVGDETAAAARRAGFGDVRSSAGNAADLARDIVAGFGSNARIAYLSGRVRLDALETELAAAGFAVKVIETYDTRQRAPSAQEMAELDRRPVKVALIYSAKAAQSLAALVATRAGTIFAETAFICISQRIAETLSQLVSGAVSAAATPDENAMFDLLPRPGHEPAPFRTNVA
jgi:uroporphyrinogen-III synthase